MNSAGMKGVASVPPMQIDTSKFRFDAEHVKERKHGVSDGEARAFQRDAAVSVACWNGRQIKYFGRDGAAYVDLKDGSIFTAFKFAEYDAHTMALMEVLARYGLA